jgi:hypothetical protein
MSQSNKIVVIGGLNFLEVNSVHADFQGLKLLNEFKQVNRDLFKIPNVNNNLNLTNNYLELLLKVFNKLNLEANLPILRQCHVPEKVVDPKNNASETDKSRIAFAISKIGQQFENQEVFGAFLPRKNNQDDEIGPILIFKADSNNQSVKDLDLYVQINMESGTTRLVIRYDAVPQSVSKLLGQEKTKELVARNFMKAFFFMKFGIDFAHLESLAEFGQTANYDAVIYNSLETHASALMKHLSELKTVVKIETYCMNRIDSDQIQIVIPHNATQVLDRRYKISLQVNLSKTALQEISKTDIITFQGDSVTKFGNIIQKFRVA